MAAGLSANTIDVSGQSSQLLQTGDALQFLFSTTSYANYASQMGMSPYPSAINFTFLTLPLGATGEFTAELESPDGASAAAFSAPLNWGAGAAQNSQYSGPTSALEASLTLSNAISQTLFSGPEAQLILTYSGPDIDIGLPGYDLPQDLMVSLMGGLSSASALSIGGMVYSAALEPAPQTAVFGDAQLVSFATGVPPAPEPSSLGLFLSGAALCLFAAALKRLRRRRLSPESAS